jgi:5-methylcytosine-specific restriction endonuclease McrA
MTPLNYTLDHIEAIAVGGVHELDNLQLAHGICNNRKYTGTAIAA